MSNIKIFNHPQFGDIRTTGTPDYPEFCAMDLCRALGYKNGRDAVATHVDEWDVVKRDTPTKNQWGAEVIQQITYVNESGLYSLILGSKLPQAKEFRRWVTTEVLPSIRKHGIYATPQTIDSILADPDNAIKLLTALKEERQQRKLAESKAALLEEVTKEQAPKVTFADAIIGSNTYIIIRDLAKMIQQNGYDIGEKRLYQWLRDNKYLTLDNKPMQRYVEQGLFFIAEGTHSENGVMKAHMTTKVTPKGQQYFINKFIQA
jgi:anti-repressor protein